MRGTVGVGNAPKEIRYATYPDRLSPPPRQPALTPTKETIPAWAMLPEPARVRVLLFLRRLLTQQLAPPPPVQEVSHEPVQE
jgi:hypothetical protein